METPSVRALTTRPTGTFAACLDCESPGRFRFGNSGRSEEFLHLKPARFPGSSSCESMISLIHNRSADSLPGAKESPQRFGVARCLRRIEEFRSASVVRKMQPVCNRRNVVAENPRDEAL